MIDELRALGAEIHQKGQGQQVSREEDERYFRKLLAMNVTLTELEQRFSFQVKKVGNLVQKIVLWLNFLTAFALGGFAILINAKTSNRLARVIESMVSVLRGVQNGERNLRMNENGPGELGSLAAAFNDLFDSDARKEARLTEHLKLESLVKALNQVAIVYQTDERGEFVSVNQKLCQIAGYSAGELTGANMRVLDSGLQGEESTASMWNALRTGSAWQGEVCRCRADGKFFWVDSAVTPVFDDEGKRRFLFIENDITSRKLIEQQALQTSKMVSLGEMAAGMAHEINNPVGIVLLVLRRLRRAISEFPNEKENFSRDLDKVENAANRIVAIVKGLLDFAHDGATEPFVATGIRLLCERALADCRGLLENAGVVVFIGEERRSQHDPSCEGLPDIRAEVRASQLVQVMVSLVANAIEAVEGLSEKWVRITVQAEANSLRISVVDSGRGIPKEIVDKIMQPFFSTKEIGKGTGLGLSISRGIVEAHGGRLYVDKVAMYTTFVIELPYKQDEIREAA